MGKTMKVPQVGESITEVTIGKWLKQDGDYVALDEILCELESDKATFEVPSEGEGILRIKAQEGDTLEIGAVICEIEPSEAQNGKEKNTASKETVHPESTESAPKEVKENKTKKEDSQPQEIAMYVPAVGESITEVTIGSWLKSDGDEVVLDEAIAEIESDKATFELTAEAQGKLKIIAKEGETLEIGALICKIEVSANDTAAQQKPALESTAINYGDDRENPMDETYAAGHASPAASKILSEKEVSPKDVQGTGVGGRITKEDALKAEKAAPKEASKTSSTEKAQNTDTGVQPSSDRIQTRSRMSSLRKTVAKRLVAAKNETAMLTTFNEVDMKPIMDLRKKYKDQFKEKYEIGLGFMSFFTKAVCMALQEWPSVNAMIDGEEMIFNEFCDVSIAVSSPKGLVVPVIRNAEKMSFDAVEKEVMRLALKAREGKLSIEEMTGGTFTITNGGIFGSMMSTPIINAPQSAILGMHNIIERPVVVNGEIVIRPMMYLALSYDHRIIDGRESVSFLVRVKQLLEDPSRLLLGI